MESAEEYTAGDSLTIAGSVVFSSVDYCRPFGTLPNRSRRASSQVLDVTYCFVQESVLGIRIGILFDEYLVFCF
jgi:hypothetical protein